MNRTHSWLVSSLPLALVVAACSASDADADDGIAISGSATVAPVTQAVASQGGFTVAVEAEGTNTGFARFCSGETAINNASSPIPGEGQREDFVTQCEDNGIDYVELPIGLDALTVIRNEDNDFATDITMDELAQIWGPDSGVETWSDVRGDWPDDPIGLYGRPEGSGTFDVFTYAVNGEAGSIRSDYETTDDLGELASWVADDDDGLAFMGVGNYLATDVEDRDRISNVDVDGVSPTLDNVQAGDYDHLTRPLFIYVSTEALDDDEVVEFVDYYVDNVAEVLPREYFYALPDELSERAQQIWEDRVTGSVFDGDPFGSAAWDEWTRAS